MPPMKIVSDSDELRSILKEIMRERNLSINAWSNLAGVSEGTMRFFLSGKNDSLKVSTLDRYLKAIGLGIKDIHIEKNHKIPVTGHIHNGAEVKMLEMNDSDVQLPFSWRMTVPVSEIHALKVMNDFLLPLIQKDWVIYYHAKHNLRRCIKKICVIRTSDARMYVKELDYGTKTGLYTLRGFNFAHMDNVKISDAFPIISVEPN